MEPQGLKHAPSRVKRVLFSLEHVLVGLVLAAGCNQGALLPNDADLSFGDFCSGAARVQLDGMTAESPAVSGRLQFLDCCDAAEFEVVSAQIKEPLFLAWRHQVGNQPNLPATLDLAHLPTGWGATLYSGCSPTAPGCTPSDLLTSGLNGTLTVSGNLGSYQMSVCLSAVAMTHPVLQTVRLWSPTVTAQ
jgi:hypothetical protein